MGNAIGALVTFILGLASGFFIHAVSMKVSFKQGAITNKIKVYDALITNWVTMRNYVFSELRASEVTDELNRKYDNLYGESQKFIGEVMLVCDDSNLGMEINSFNESFYRTQWYGMSDKEANDKMEVVKKEAITLIENMRKDVKDCSRLERGDFKHMLRGFIKQEKNRNKIKKTKIISFMIGAFLFVCAFFVPNAEEFPLVLNLFAKNYTNGSEALYKLTDNSIPENEKIITKKDKGFETLAGAYYSKTIGVTAGIGSDDDGKVINFKGITGNVHDAGTGYRGNFVQITLNNGHRGTVISSVIELYLDKLLKNRLMFLQKWLFIVGLLSFVISGISKIRDECK